MIIVFVSINGPYHQVRERANLLLVIKLYNILDSGQYYIACRAYTTQCGAAGSAASTTVSVQSSYMVYSDGSSKIVDVIENQLENDE